MGIKAKLLARFKKEPKDFTFSELTRLFRMYGFSLENSGSTSGSRVKFVNREMDLQYRIHKPHPSNIIKKYVIKQVLEYLKTNKFV